MIVVRDFSTTLEMTRSAREIILASSRLSVSAWRDLVRSKEFLRLAKRLSQG